MREIQEVLQYKNYMQCTFVLLRYVNMSTEN